MSSYRTGKLITVDGIDGVGKNTQSLKLVEFLTKLHGQCGFFSFPRYETPTGKLVGEYLKSGRNDLNLLERAALYSADRAAARLEIMDYLMRGIDVVCDRYVDSNIAFFSSFAKMEQNVSRNYDMHVKHFILELEYKQYHLPKPDMTFILSMSPEKARQLVLKKDKRNYTDAKLDAHESNDQLLELTSDFYNKHALTGGDHYNLIDCVDKEVDAVRTIDDIHKEITDKYVERFGPKTLKL